MPLINIIKNMVNTTNPLPIKERVQQVKKTIEEKLDNDKNQ